MKTTTPPATDRYLTTDEAAALIGVVPAMITKLRLTGVLPAVVIGPKCIRIRESDLHAYMLARLKGGDGVPARGSVHPNLDKARFRRAPKAQRAERSAASATQSHPAAPATGETANA